MLAPSASAFVRIAALEGLQHLLQTRNVAFEPLLNQHAIDPALLRQPDRRIAFRQFVDLLNHAAVVAGDDCLGMHLGIAQSLHVSGVMGYAVQASPDVRTQLEMAGRYFRLHQEEATVRVQVAAGTVTVSYEVSDPQVTLHRQDVEMTLAQFVNNVRALTGLPQWAPQSVHFVHQEPLPASQRELRRFFGCGLSFGDAFDGLRFPEAFLDTPARTSDPALLNILKQYADDCLARDTGRSSWTGRTRRLIASSLSTGRASIDDVAQALSMTPRTLQRRLADEGKQFSDLVEDTRRDLAVEYLRDVRLSLSDAAFLVGYSDLTAFHRAFRRWFGQTPLEYQRELQAAR